MKSKKKRKRPRPTAGTMTDDHVGVYEEKEGWLSVESAEMRRGGCGLAIERNSKGREILRCGNCGWWRYATPQEIEQMAEAHAYAVAQGLKQAFAQIKTQKVKNTGL